jgi:hypothetical protein
MCFFKMIFGNKFGFIMETVFSYKVEKAKKFYDIRQRKNVSTQQKRIDIIFSFLNRLSTRPAGTSTIKLFTTVIYGFS